MNDTGLLILIGLIVLACGIAYAGYAVANSINQFQLKINA